MIMLLQSTTIASRRGRGRSPASLLLVGLCLLGLLLGGHGAEDYYKILKVKRTASQSEIKKAWRKLSLDLHPDKNNSPTAQDDFATASNAYTILSNEEKREVYDREGVEGLKRMDAREQQGGMDPFGGGIFEAFGFGGFGGGGRRRDEEMKTPNVVIPLRVSLKQLYTGDILEVTYVRQVLCMNHKECTKSDSSCHGPGVRIRQQQIAPGFVQQVQVRDESCVARGKSWKKGCAGCPKGQTQSEEVKLTVDIVPGMKDGDTISFGEVADEKVGHSAGDLIVHIQAIPHQFYTRQGDDLKITLKVGLLDALVGFETSVQQVDGREVSLIKPTVTSHGEVQRVKGQGMPKKNGNGLGDLLITWEVTFPEAVTDAQKVLLRQALA